MRVVSVLVCLAWLAPGPDTARAWKWGKLFGGDSDSDSVVTIAADSRGLFPVFRGVRTVVVRVPSPRDFHAVYGPPVVTRIRPPYVLPPPPPPPGPYSYPYPYRPYPFPPPPPPPRYGPPPLPPPPQSTFASDTAAAVASAVARTIIEAHEYGKSYGAVGDISSGEAASSSGNRGRALHHHWSSA